MFIKSLLCIAFVACICELVSAQFYLNIPSSTTQGPSQNQSSSASNSSSLNATSNVDAQNATLGPQAPVTQFFEQIAHNQVFGLKKCKKPKDCGLGLRCDLLLNLCVPFSLPILSDIEKPCSNDTECSLMHSCQAGLCRFCGPKSCRNSFDCCAGSFAEPGKPGKFYECMNIEDTEKLSLAKQLGRVPAGFQPIPKAAGGKSVDFIESGELIQLGIQPAVGGKNPFYGKRCWSRCNVDTDCYSERTPQHVKQNLGCCDGVCRRKAECHVLSPQVIQHAQQLQQQRIQQQQMWAQQQAMLGQQNQPGQKQSQWGAGGHQQVVPVALAQPVIQAQPVYVPVMPAAAPPKPVPQSWAQAQQQVQPAPSWQQQQQPQSQASQRFYF